MSAASAVKGTAGAVTVSHGRIFVILGLLIAAIVPAIFWTAAVAGAVSVIGHEPSWFLLSTTAGMIAGLLSCVYCALCVRPH
ncbi:MAG: hypothetical protein NW216_08110 [Hyphomicrobium sp.]|nr:hypothetical protein [Hyphomicrobium sp.]